MSDADKLFLDLGYRKYTWEGGEMFEKDLFRITFISQVKRFITEYKKGDFNFPEIRPFEISMQELKAINAKVKELRMG